MEEILHTDSQIFSGNKNETYKLSAFFIKCWISKDFIIWSVLPGLYKAAGWLSLCSSFTAASFSHYFPMSLYFSVC